MRVWSLFNCKFSIIVFVSNACYALTVAVNVTGELDDGAASPNAFIGVRVEHYKKYNENKEQ